METKDRAQFTRANPQYVVAIRTWFDKTGGNSYFTGRIWGGDELVTIPFQYGYEGSYEQAACVALGMDYNAWAAQDWENKRNIFGIEHVEVMRRKDLHYIAK